jgi:serine/threonine-protein kinase
MSGPNETRSGVNTALAERIQRLRERYEAEWLVADKGGPEPSIERYLQDTPEPERPEVAEALSEIDRFHRARRSSGGTSIPNDVLPTAIGWPETGDGPTFAPTVQLPIDRHAPSLPPTHADEPKTGSGSYGETLAPTLPPTRAPETIAHGLPPTLGMDASGVTVEHDPHPKVKADRARPKGPREAPKVEGYEILGELGRGGMGVVYKARHVKLDRVVALKMVLAGAHASQSQLDRFILEAQAVARLQHPDIVQVFEVGEHDGLPYFSLEFVEGGTLAHKLGGKPMAPPAAAEMALILAGAMQVAHRKSIIHRDLKPANILLTAEGLPKITDFGLAKKLEDEESHQTRSGAIMGTPSYMSPEQAWGETDKIGPLADQYALGAILYEMLTGRPPFQGATPLDTLEQVRSQEPVPPTRLQPKIPKDLETICLKALQKESKKRYADCEELASDLQRFLDNKPILARPVSQAEKVRRWCVRNPRVAFLSVAVVVLMISATAISTASYFSILATNKVIDEKNQIAERQRIRAIKGEADAKTQAAIAEKNADEAERQSGVALQTLRDVAGGIQRKLQEYPSMQRLQYDLIKLTVDRIDQIKLIAKTSGKQGIPFVRAGAHQQLGITCREMGRWDEAVQNFAVAEKYISEQLAADPDDGFFQEKLAAVKNTIADAHRSHYGNTELARKYFREALELRKQVVKKHPSDDTRVDVANSLGLVGMCTLDLGDPEGARKLFDEEVEWREQLSPDYQRQHPDAKRELASLYDKLGNVMMRLGEPIKAQDYFEKMLQVRTEVLNDPYYEDKFTARMDLALAYNALGGFKMIEMNDPKGARRDHEQALELNRVLHRDNPEQPTITDNLAVTYYYLATAALRAGDKAAAEKNYRECLALRRKQVAGPEAKNRQVDLVIALARCGYHEEAARRIEDVLKNPPQDARIYFQAACGYALSAGSVAGDKPKAELTEAERALIETYRVKALEALRTGISRGYRSLGDLKIDPDLDPIRDDPRFQAVLDDLQRILTASK